MKPAARVIYSAATIALGCAEARAEPERAQRDAAEVRAERTLAQMTQEEKIQLLHGTMPLFIPAAKRAPACRLVQASSPG